MKHQLETPTQWTLFYSNKETTPYTITQSELVYDESIDELVDELQDDGRVEFVLHL